MGFQATSRTRTLLPAALIVALAIYMAAPVGGPVAAAATLQLNPTADAWTNSARPKTNYGSASVLRARKGASQSFLRFNLSAWQGLRVEALALRLTGVEGSASSLRSQRTETGWKEGTITNNTRPAVLQSLNGGPQVSGGSARFDLRPFFPGGVIDRTILSVRVTNNQDALVKFGSRESPKQPQLILTPGPRLDVVRLPAIQDTWANRNKPSTNYKSAKSLRVSGQPRQETYLKFDLSAWRGHTYASLHVQLQLSDGGGAGVAVYRVGTGWKEGKLTWNNRPTGGTLLTTINKALATGAVTINVSSAFSGGQINSGLLGLRIVGTHSDGIAFSSREGTSAPRLRITPGTGPSPSPTPTPTPIPSPTPSSPPTPTPIPSPTPSSPPTPTPTPTPTPAPTPTPTPTAAPLFHFRGNGSDHGVGLSQYGARYRANAGQTYQEILAHYYTDTGLGTIEPGLAVRVRLASSHVPTPALPARIVALNGGWQSAAFPGGAFPANSYLEMAPTVEGGWNAVVVDSGGMQLASLPDATDLLMEPAESTTLFEMKFRDSLRAYDRYRGQMRLRVNGTGIMAVNIVSMNDYLRGVVPAEMPASWHMNAVRAQAVASRGYVYAKLRTTGFHDVVPTSNDQVYGGVNIEHSRSNTAVAETDRVVVNYNGKPVQTFFFALAGGHTENNEFVFSVSASGNPNGAPLAYLRGRPDHDADGLPWDRNAPNFAWHTASFTLGQLSAILANDSRTSVGELISITFDRGVSGRAYRVTLIGTVTEKVVSGNVFKNVYNTHRLSGGNLRSNMYFLEPAS